MAGIPLWLFEESYPVVGDLAETIALVLPDTASETDHGLSYWIENLRRLSDQDEAARKAFVASAWQQLGGAERFVFNKLITVVFGWVSVRNL